MTVNTVFSKADLSTIISDYGLGKMTKLSPFKSGTVQTNIKLETTKGKYVFRYYETRSEKYALFEINLLEYLSKHSYPSPKPVKNKTGKYIGNFKGKSFVILEFMEGDYSNNIDNHKQIADVIGQLHQITTGYKTRFYEFREAYSPKSCWENATVNAEKIKSEKEAKSRLDWLKKELKVIKIPDTLPYGVCHADTHPSNFLFTDGKLTGVLDFDDASYVPLLYDIANMIYYWAWPHKESLITEKAKEILAEYDKYRKLTDVEKESLYDLLKMVIFMSIGWFINLDDDYIAEKKKIEALNILGRKEFYLRIFG